MAYAWGEWAEDLCLDHVYLTKQGDAWCALVRPGEVEQYERPLAEVARQKPVIYAEALALVADLMHLRNVSGSRSSPDLANALYRWGIITKEEEISSKFERDIAGARARACLLLKQDRTPVPDSRS